MAAMAVTVFLFSDGREGGGGGGFWLIIMMMIMKMIKIK